MTFQLRPHGASRPIRHAHYERSPGHVALEAPLRLIEESGRTGSDRPLVSTGRLGRFGSKVDERLLRGSTVLLELGKVSQTERSGILGRVTLDNLPHELDCTRQTLFA